MRIEEYCGMGEKTPFVGMKCTLHYYSDSEPATVTRISKSGKTLWVRKNKTEADSTKENGMGHQNWIIHDELQGEEKRFFLTKSGKWYNSGKTIYLQLGTHHKYYDWSF